MRHAIEYIFEFFVEAVGGFGIDNLIADREFGEHFHADSQMRDHLRYPSMTGDTGVDKFTAVLSESIFECPDKCLLRFFVFQEQSFDPISIAEHRSAEHPSLGFVLKRREVVQIDVAVPELQQEIPRRTALADIGSEL